MPLPGLVMTGATGFLGRHLLGVLKDRFRIHAVARRTPHEVGAPEHPNITWYQGDIGDPESIDSVFHEVVGAGGADLVLHFAAHYDFTGDPHPEYHRTNIVGLRNVLDLTRLLRPRRFVFTSSVAACDFPRPGTSLDERSPPDGDHIYAQTKAVGEAMLAEYSGSFPSVIVRLGALFSDFCEYPPLFMFLSTWLSTSWKATMLGGKGESAIPYIHVRDVVSFFARLVDRLLEDGCDIADREILLASTDGATSHRKLHAAATQAYYGKARRAWGMPKPIARVGISMLDLMGRILGERPFERPWMGAYIDKVLAVDARHSRERLGWQPHQRLDVLRRMPFLVENLRTDPIEWHRRNLAAMKTVRLATHLRLYQLLAAHESELIDRSVRFSTSPETRHLFPNYSRLPLEDLRWAALQTYMQLQTAIRTRDKAVFRRYCRDVAARRFRQGFDCAEVIEIVRVKEDICLEVMHRDPRFNEMKEVVEDLVTMTFRLGIDEVLDTFEELSGEPVAEVETGPRVRRA